MFLIPSQYAWGHIANKDSNWHKCFSETYLLEALTKKFTYEVSMRFKYCNLEDEFWRINCKTTFHVNITPGVFAQIFLQASIVSNARLAMTTNDRNQCDHIMSMVLVRCWYMTHYIAVRWYEWVGHQDTASITRGVMMLLVWRSVTCDAWQAGTVMTAPISRIPPSPGPRLVSIIVAVLAGEMLQVRSQAHTALHQEHNYWYL